MTDDDDYETLDLSLFEGVTTYIERTLCADIHKAFAMRGSVSPYGVALGTVKNGVRLIRPEAMGVGAFGMGLQNVERVLRKLVENTAATGAILVHTKPFTLKDGNGELQCAVVRLEHKEFGDHVWVAEIKFSALGVFMQSTLADSLYAVPKTTFMPNRWMH